MTLLPLLPLLPSSTIKIECNNYGITLFKEFMMTLTVKLDAPLEQALRSRCVTLGRSVSAVVRDALQAYLARTEPPKPSSYALGQDLFGQHAGPTELATQRKAELMKIWDQKHPANPRDTPHGAL